MQNHNFGTLAKQRTVPLNVTEDSNSICQLFQRFANDILTLFGNLMIWKYWITHRGIKALVKRCIFMI